MAQIKQRNQLLVLAALVLFAAVIWYVAFRKPKASGPGFVMGSENYTPINAQDFSSVFSKLKSTQTTEYKSSGRNIFVASAAPEAPNPDAPKPGPPPRRSLGPQPPPEPPVPVLPWKFFGYGALPAGGSRQAFLLDGDEVHIVGEGEVVLNHIRITHIGNDRIDYEDTGTGKRNSNQLEFAPNPAA